MPAVKPFKRNDLCVSLYPKALLHNVKALRSCCEDGVKFCAVVKANAYGHGICEVVNILKDAGVEFFCVANIYEAFYIFEMVDSQQILVLEPLHPAQSKEAIVLCAKLGLHCTLTSMEMAEYVGSILKDNPVRLKVHVNVDTGMGRCGIGLSESEKLVEFVSNCQSMELAGVYTHFTTANQEDLSFAKEQLEKFKGLLENLQGYILDSTIIHAANSSATIRIPDAHFDMVRCGISIYGYSAIKKNLPIELKPALKLEVPIVHIATIEKGQTVGYGRTFMAQRDTKIAVLPIGHSDGFLRIFSNKAKLVINDSIVPVIGKVTMNQIVINVTDVDNVKAGQMVTVIDDKFDWPCGVYSLAETAETVCYEILTDIPRWAEITII